MLFLWVLLSIVIIAIIAYVLFTVVFCFWFIYLVDAIKRKSSFYKAAIRCMLGKSDLQQQMLAYNAKTQLVKFVMLFILNLIEWAGITLVFLLVSEKIVQTYHQEFETNYSSIASENDSKFRLPYFDNVCVVLSLSIIGSLCMYVSARYAQKSWITSNSIPYWIFFFCFSSIASQILVMICYTNVIGIWCDRMVFTISVIFAWKQYRKLNMVIQWSIVDLSVSKSIELKKYIKMKRRFNRIFMAIWIGASCLLVANIFCLIYATTQLILHIYSPVL